MNIYEMNIYYDDESPLIGIDNDVYDIGEAQDLLGYLEKKLGDLLDLNEDSDEDSDKYSYEEKIEILNEKMSVLEEAIRVCEGVYYRSHHYPCCGDDDYI